MVLGRRVIKSSTGYQLLQLTLWALGGSCSSKYLASCTAEIKPGFVFFFLLFYKGPSILEPRRIECPRDSIQRQFFYLWFPAGSEIPHNCFGLGRVCPVAEWFRLFLHCGYSMKSGERPLVQENWACHFRETQLLADLNCRNLITCLEGFSMSQTRCWA